MITYFIIFFQVFVDATLALDADSSHCLLSLPLVPISPSPHLSPTPTSSASHCHIVHSFHKTKGIHSPIGQPRYRAEAQSQIIIIF